jgi:hypothetical protein
LNISDPSERFLVYTDESKEGLGGVLTQNGHVIVYESRNIKEYERKYSTHDLELSTIVHALNMWMHYLMGKRFELRIDCSGLNYLFENPTLNARKTRWLEFLSEYDFDINHIKGKENKVVDALSRGVHLMHATTVSMHQSDLKSIILDVFVIDKNYLQIKKILQ